MKQSLKTRIVCLLLAVVMVLSLSPMTIFATEGAEPASKSTNESTTNETAGSNTETAVASAEGTFPTANLAVVTERNSSLAPGVEQDAYTLYNNKGEQVKMFVTKADVSVDTVKLFASYKDMDPTNYGMSKLTEQVGSFNEKAAAGDEYYQGTVVAGINASYYNMITGKPTGAFVMNGIDVTTESEGNAYGYFAVMKDGTVKIGNKNDYSSDKGNIQEAIGIYTMLIVNGEICSGLNTVQYYPRQTIGVTADGNVILMTADGNQAPNSVGLTVLEQAQVMLDLGCVWAGHLDGGGSCTYAAKSEGSNEFKIENSPSDGSERSISNGFIIVSTAVSDGKFKSASLTAEYEYVTPNATVKISANGVDQAGGPAEIPENVSWQLADSSFGDITNGVFTSTGKTGAAVIQMVYEGRVVGETTVHVVIPDSVQFGNSEMVVPFSKAVELVITATYGVKDVTIKPEDFVFTLSQEIGAIDGFVFTALDTSEITSAVLTATCVYDEKLTASTNVTLGKGSEVVYDFEDGTAQSVVINETPNTKYNYVWPEVTEQGVYTAETGKVHSGNYALGATVNYGNSLESGYMKTSVYATESKVFENATKVGVWIYIPDELVGLWARWTLRSVTFDDAGNPVYASSTINSNNLDTSVGGTGVVYTFDEPGWHYLWADVSAYNAVGWNANSAMMQFYISDRDGSAYGYTASQQSNIPGKFRIYLDDFTVDYSSAVDDREAPVVSNLTYAAIGMPDAIAVNNQTVTTGQLTFAANISDFNKSNATGIDESTVKVYIDGVEVASSYTNGIVSASADLTNGKHTIKVSACDSKGNYGYKYGYITVNGAETESTVKLIAHDPEVTYIKLGSIYEMDLVATAIEEVQSVQIVIDLDNNSTWQLDHMIVTDGFEANHYVEKAENIATLTITRTGENSQTGEAVLATLPVRVWTLKTGYTYPNGTKAGAAAYTLAQFKSMKEFWRMSVIAEVDKGILTRVDSSVDTFTGERVFCDTEMWGNFAAMDATAEGKAYYSAWNGGHLHNAESIDDMPATCTKAGYRDRTYCDGCSSVVDWGITVPATGHTYEVVNNVLKCVCGELYNGIYTDGKTYVDGVVVADGWNGDSYYKDGVKLTGLQEIDGAYYDFGADGICAGKVKLDGFYYNEDAQAYMYFTAGLKVIGDYAISNVPHYFDGNGYALNGEVVIMGYRATFDERGAFVSAENTSVLEAGFVGSNLEFVLLSDGTLKIGGSGEMRDYTYNGVYGPWFYEHVNSVNHVIIGKDITSIGSAAFNRCEYLRTITFEEGSQMKVIGDYAFRAAHRLEAVKLPKTVEIIEDYAFFMCGAMKTFEFEEGTVIKEIGRMAFHKTMYLEEIIIPATVIKIGEKLFDKGNANITMLVVENSAAHIYAVENGISFKLIEGVLPPAYSGNCSESITWAIYPNGTMVISGTGAMPNYASQNDQPWAVYRHLIKVLEVDKDITAIGNYAFAYTTNLASVNFEEGSTLERIGVLSFMNAASLKEVVLPETVTYIGAYGFSDCFALTSVDMPYGVSFIGGNAFRKNSNMTLNVVEGSYSHKYAEANGITYKTSEYVYEEIASGKCGDNATWVLYTNGELRINGTGAMTNLTTHTEQPWHAYGSKIKAVVIGKDITAVGNYAFAYIPTIESITFAEGSKLQRIGVLSFMNAAGVKEVVLPETVTYIGAYGFSDCFALASVDMPYGVSFIGGNAFRKNSNMTLNVVEGSYSHKYAEANGITYKTSAYVYEEMVSGKCGDNATWVLYTNGELRINGTGAMTNLTTHTEQPWHAYGSKIKAVVIGKDITAVGNYAFAYIPTIESITFAEGSKLQRIGVLSFMNAAGVKEVVLPETVTYIGAYGFSDCFALTSVDMPYGVSFIGGNAFRKNSNMTLNVVEGSYSHKYAEANGITYKTSEYVYEEIASGKCGDNATWVLYTNGELCINGTGAMTNLTTHTEQPWYAYGSKIKAVVIGKDITAVGNYAFAYIPAIESITFAEGSKLQRIGVLSFMNAAGVKEVVLPETVTYIGAYGFSDCFALTSVKVPESVSFIGGNAFRKATNLTLSVAEGSYAHDYARNNNIACEVR